MLINTSGGMGINERRAGYKKVTKGISSLMVNYTLYTKRSIMEHIITNTASSVGVVCPDIIEKINQYLFNKYKVIEATIQSVP